MNRNIIKPLTEEEIIERSKILGAKEVIINDSLIYLLAKPYIGIMYIPKDVKTFNKEDMMGTIKSPLHDYINGLQALSISGGSGLEDAHNMFMGINIENFEIGYFDTVNITDASAMFSDFKSTKLNMNDFRTDSLKLMYYMFCGCNIGYLNMSHFEFNKNMQLKGLFQDCKIETLDISLLNFEDYEYKQIEDIFKNSKIDNLIVNNTEDKLLLDILKKNNCQYKSVKLSKNIDKTHL